MSYPYAPGFQATDTSKWAADSVMPSMRDMSLRVLAAIRSAGPDGMTSDEAASAVGLSILAIRPRVTELKILGFVTDSGMRRANDSGRKAIVYRTTP